MSEPLKKALLEFGRMAVLAVVPVLVVYLTAPELEWKALGIALGLALLKTLDKFLHESGKENKNDSLTKGLTRF